MNIESKHHLFILGSLFAAMFPHMVRLPLWITVCCIFFYLYSFQVSRKKWRLPRPIVQQLLTVAGFLSVLATFGFKFDRDTCVGLLAVMSGLKALEIQSYRDKIITVFLAYFIVLSNLLYSDSLSMTLYMLLSVLATTGALIALNDRKARIVFSIAFSARMMLQALPVMIACFFLFPRLSGGLWGIESRSTSRVGFTDSLAPGDITKIVRNNDIAFRATFFGPRPKPDQLYWRGLVFWQFDGHKWRRGIRVPYQRQAPPGQGRLTYTIELEPHLKRWGFALDIPVSTPRFMRLLGDHTLVSRRRVKRKISYTLHSDMAYQTGPLKPWEQIAHQLPADGNPKATALGKQWADRFQNPQTIVATAIRYLKENRFTYTLEPPPLQKNDRIDDFLFRTRKGYCEHFASAFAFLMRASGIPARVVVGFLGGEQNPFGDYYIVRQSDAHAWVEVWLPAGGWTRIDPTTTLVPQRLDQGLAESLPLAERPAYLKYAYLAPIFKSVKKIQLGWDAANVHWSRWVIGYTHRRQKILFVSLGIGSTSFGGIFKIIGILLGALVISAILFLSTRRMPRPRRKDSVQETYDLFCQKLSRVGIVRRPSQGPLDFARYVQRQRKDLSDKITDITKLYIELRYGARPEKSASKTLTSMVKRFKPHRNKSGSPQIRSTNALKTEQF